MTLDPDDSTTRLFFAIVPDDAARERLGALARSMAHASGGRASAAATLHLTIVFVGTVAAATVAGIRAAGDSVAWPSVEVSLDTAGSFARAGIAWAAPSRVPPALSRANRDLVRALSDRGVATEARPWRPHVTLARRCARLVDGPIEPPIAWTVDHVVLMSSRLLSEGPRYREVAGWSTSA
ncbi:RNA 2',3'-cyclic phosphodiesterase [Burkholderiales bacterium]|nr:RNA 2',3'-cyclic phosphodiesterase [Burkholderiales bacterium]